MGLSVRRLTDLIKVDRIKPHTNVVGIFSRVQFDRSDRRNGGISCSSAAAVALGRAAAAGAATAAAYVGFLSTVNRFRSDTQFLTVYAKYYKINNLTLLLRFHFVLFH